MKRTPFTTDGCSGGMSWAWHLVTRLLGRETAPPWEGACARHDYLYWHGGTWEERKRADQLLLVHVTKSGHPWIAIAMFAAVRIGGHPLLPFSWRWGYGWPWPRGYKVGRSVPRR